MPAPLNDKTRLYSADYHPAALDWRTIPLHTLKAASSIAGVSTASLYNYARDGRLTLKRLAGRTLVDTTSLITLIDSAEPWTPSKKTAAAVARRPARARSSWGE